MKADRPSEVTIYCIVQSYIDEKRHFGHYFCVSKLPFSELPDMLDDWHRRSRAFHVKMRRFLVLQLANNIVNVYINN